MSSIADGVVTDHTVDDPETEDNYDTREVLSIAAVELDSCSDVHVGTRLHYHGPVVINQNFVNTPPEGELKHREVSAPSQHFEVIKDEGSNDIDVVCVNTQTNARVPATWCTKRSGVMAVIVAVFVTNAAFTLTLTRLVAGKSESTRDSYKTKVNATQPTASFRDYSEMANYLQKQCINVDECLNLFAAVKSGDKNFVQFLLIAADMKAVNSKGWTPLHIASYSGKRDIVEVMAQHGANLSIETANRIGDPPVHLSAAKGHVDLTEWFLNKGISVMVRNKFGSTILHAAASKGHLKLCRLLIDRGADVNARMTFQRMSVPLHKAVLYRHFDVACLLIDQGADLDVVTDDTNETPLHYAAKNGDYKMVEFLISRGANSTITDNSGKTARDVALACSHTRVAELLARHLAQVERNSSDKMVT